MNVPHTKQVRTYIRTNGYCIGYATWVYEIRVTVDVVDVAWNGNKVH